MSKYKVSIGLLVAVGAIVAIVFLMRTPFRSQPDITVLRVGVLPDVAEANLRNRYSPLLDHLSRETGLKFQLVMPESYNDLLHLFADQEIELAFFGGLTFVRGFTFHGAKPLVMRDIDTRFTSYFVVRADGPLRNCLDLTCGAFAGKTISFGSKLSTSGHLMPRHFMAKVMGKEPESNFVEVRYSGAHDKTVYQVRDGEVDLGAINSEIYLDMQKDGRLKPGELRIIWETPPYPNYVWAVQNQLSEGLKTNLRNAFLMLKTGNEDHARILSPMGAKSFLPAGAAEFAPLKEIAKSLGLLQPEKP